MYSEVKLTFVLAVLLVVFAFLSVAAAILVAIPGCAHVPPAPPSMITGTDMPDRLYCVERDDKGECVVFRSAQPTMAQFKAMVDRFGLKSVVKLNTGLALDGGEDIVPDEVLVTREDWLPAGPVDHEKVMEALEDLEALPRPVLVHCAHGQDRTGLLVGLYRVNHGSLAYAAWNEMLAFGFHTSLFMLADAFKAETGFHP